MSEQGKPAECAAQGTIVIASGRGSREFTAVTTWPMAGLIISCAFGDGRGVLAAGCVGEVDVLAGAVLLAGWVKVRGSAAAKDPPGLVVSPGGVGGHCGRVGEVVRSVMSGAWVMTAFAIWECGRLWSRA